MSTKELNKSQVDALLAHDIPFKFWGIIWRNPGAGLKKRAFYKIEIGKEFAADAEELLHGS